MLILGAVAWQFPLGWLADRIDRQRLLGLAGLAGALVPLALLAVVPAGWLVWPLLFVYGGIALGYYTLGLAHLGARFAPGELAVANAGFMVLYETGTTLGPALAGAGMEVWAPHGYLAGAQPVRRGFRCPGRLASAVGDGGLGAGGCAPPAGALNRSHCRYLLGGPNVRSDAASPDVVDPDAVTQEIRP